jgi:hypothetical protein
LDGCEILADPFTALLKLIYNKNPSQTSSWYQRPSQFSKITMKIKTLRVTTQ